MRIRIQFCLALLAGVTATALAADSSKPLRGLYVTGGCCHDYTSQQDIFPQGVRARTPIEWTVVNEGGNGVKRKDIEKSLYQNPDWAKGYDIVVHNECFASDVDPQFIEKVLAPHRAGVAAVVVHCTMHTFRDFQADAFREFLGVTSKRHGPQHPLDVKVVNATHPVMKGFPSDWKTGNEELYAIEKTWPTTIPLATAADKKKDESGNWAPTAKEHTLIWLNTYGKGRVFGTTLAHNNKTMNEPVFLDLVTRGILWACDKLDENGLPKK
ncbi:MAG: ThuA domain-containing protein [Verrucomicrobia bacterium]|nr:ThuA domain-containing protein [Verrucomicrobiota bacterium]